MTDKTSDWKDKAPEQIIAEISSLVQGIEADPGPTPDTVQVHPAFAVELDALNDAHERGDCSAVRAIGRDAIGAMFARGVG